MRLLSIILVIAGIICIAVPSFTFFTRERAVDAGFFSIDVSKPHTIFLNPGLGAIMLIVGIIMMVTAPKRSAL